ncbi:MAG: patatin-like protein [Novosphingobium sp.]|nr:patatin-like protein [Novosphingobium sp.]
MRQKELRIALVCYGGVSLAVYMHGVTKEIWKAVRASRAYRDGITVESGTEAIYARLLGRIEEQHKLRLRILTDIVAGASAGGINSIFLAQAIHSGQSLEPLTELWLERADVDILLDPDARPWSRFTKFWAAPLVRFVLSRPGNAISSSVATETRAEVRGKLSRLIRSRWFEPPFSGIGFSRLICEAIAAMSQSETTGPLLPQSHPIDLFVTATDFKGHLEALHLHSPKVVQESEHRLPIGIHAATPLESGESMASPVELVFAARATASFPGAFPPLQINEIDKLAAERNLLWDTREAFLNRIMPEHSQHNELDGVSLIDGSVLVNAPFADAMAVLRGRPAHREVDRRIVYIDPRPDRIGSARRDDPHAPGFFSVIFGSLSSIPREQPIRDNLEVLEQQSREMATLRSIVHALRPEVEQTVEKLFGRTLFFYKPSIKRLGAWRAKAQNAACKQSGFAYQGYAQVKFSGIVGMLAETVLKTAPQLDLGTADPIANCITTYLRSIGLNRLTETHGGATAQAIDFFRANDIAFRVRRLRLLLRRLTQDWDGSDEITEDVREHARDVVYDALSLYFECENPALLGEDFPELAGAIFEDPSAVLTRIALKRDLTELDLKVDSILASAMVEMPNELRRHLLLAYLGFPFYDTVTLPLLRGEGMTEFDPVKVDRISPDDAGSIRPGGAQDTLRGVEFYNFGAFFSRAYRENDYLWGRLHGAERVVDLIASALPEGDRFDPSELALLKHDAFLAILDEEEDRLRSEPSLVPRIRAEVLAKRG